MTRRAEHGRSARSARVSAAVAAVVAAVWAAGGAGAPGAASAQERPAPAETAAGREAPGADREAPGVDASAASAAQQTTPGPADTVTIAAATADADGDFVPDRAGDTVTVAGRATVGSGVLHRDRLMVFLQDSTGGIQLYAREMGAEISRGDRVVATGVVGQYRGQTQLRVENYRVEPATPDAAPEPVAVPEPDSAVLEAHEGRLVRLQAIVVGKGENEGGTYLWVFPEGGDRRIQVFAANWRGVPVDLGGFEAGDRVEITGLAGQYDPEPPYTSYHQVYPRSPADLRRPTLALGLTGDDLQLGWNVLVVLLVGGLGMGLYRYRRELADLARRHRVLFEENVAGVFRSTVEGDFVDCNRALAELYGYGSREEMLEARAWDVYADLSDREAYLRRLREQGKVEDYLHHHVTRDGEDLWVLENARLVETGDDREEIVGTLVDLTDRVEAERRQKAAEERYRALFEQNVAGAFRSDPEGELVEVNPAFARMLGYDSPEELEGRPAAELYESPERRDELIEKLEREGSLDNEELALRTKDGDTVWVLENSFLVDDPETGETVNVGTVTEITEHVHEERELEALAHRDPLTEIPNRRYLEDTVPQLVAQSDRDGKSLGLVYLDLNDFKEINDRWGHGTGDAVLQRVARRLEETVREADLVGRVGGDEFVIVLPGLEKRADALKATRRLVRTAFRDPVEVEGERFDVTAKLGLAVFPEHGSAFDELVTHADRAMYRASRNGDMVALYDETLDQPYTGRIQRRGRIREALEDGEIVGHVQPIYRLGDRRLAGVELLARWERSEDEVLGPGAFLPLVQEADLLAELDRKMLRQAGRYADEWRGGTVSANLSQAFLEAEGAVEAVRSVLREHPAAGDFLVAEVTEQTALDAAARETVEAIAEMGLRVSLDDFGTGYSSLSVLSELPVAEVKADRTLVEAIGEGGRAENLMGGVLDLARSLDVAVVGEGVERDAQLDWLAEHRCDRVQGFLLSRAVPPEASLPATIDEARRSAEAEPTGGGG